LSSFCFCVSSGSPPLLQRSLSALAAPLAWGLFHQYRGETEKAADWWEKAIDQRDPNAVIAPRLMAGETLRTSPRWPALAKRMNLPKAAW